MRHRFNAPAAFIPLKLTVQSTEGILLHVVVKQNPRHPNQKPLPDCIIRTSPVFRAITIRTEKQRLPLLFLLQQIPGVTLSALLCLGHL
jgi:hypothetical protein